MRQRCYDQNGGTAARQYCYFTYGIPLQRFRLEGLGS